MAAGIDWRMGVEQNVSAILALMQLTGRRDVHNDPRQARALHAMSVLAIDRVVVKPIHQIRRLLVILCLADGLDEFIAVDLAFVQVDRNAAVRDIADIAVMQWIEVRDVEKVLDQKEIIGTNIHGTDHNGFPIVRPRLRCPRRLALLAFCGIARPDPDEAVLLDNREWSDLGLWRNRAGGVRWDHHAFAAHVIAQTMVGAFECAVLHEPSLGQRKAFVGAAVVIGNDVAVLRPPRHDGALADDMSRQCLWLELTREAGDIPAVSRVVSCVHGSFLSSRSTPCFTYPKPAPARSIGRSKPSRIWLGRSHREPCPYVPDRLPDIV